MAITLNGTTGIVTPKLNSPDIELNSVNVVERGSNANGEYVRFADGTQICTHAFSGALTTAPWSDTVLQVVVATWTFPAAFTGSPSMSGTGYDNARIGIVMLVAGGGVTGSVRYLTATSNPTSSTIQVTAIGRWF